MNRPTLLSTVTLPVPNLISRSPLRCSFVSIALALAWFAVPLTTRAQLSPAPDGGYPGGNTAEGDNALYSLTSGTYNTAIGTGTLVGDTTGSKHTATGYQALVNNITGRY